MVSNELTKKSQRFVLRQVVNTTLMTIVACAIVACAILMYIGAPARAATGCGNETLRSQLNSMALPDCRAYEMLTPAYHEGYPVFPSAFSSNGEKALLTTYGTFAEAPGAGEEAEDAGVYLDTRTPAGWRVTPMNPPLSEFVGQVLIAGEIEDGETLWDQHTPQQSAVTRGLYIRTEQGEYKYIGRLNPIAGGEEESNVMQVDPSDYDRPIASTQNYDHIAIFAPDEEDYWKEIDGRPFDGTSGNGGSLYEYSGTNNSQPTIVEVEGEKGSTKLAGECGAVMGSGLTGSEYNALSVDGEIIIFTLEPKGSRGCPETAMAPMNPEIYVREHGSDATALQAKTIDVSASECTEECGEESGKEFEGASETDEKIFFTSTQKLTDEAADGTKSGDAVEGCATAREYGGCNLYEADFEPASGHHKLNLIAGGDEVLGVAAIAENGARVYFVATKALPGYEKKAHEGQPNLYVYDTATKETSFIATLDTSDELDWQRDQAGRDVELAGKDGQFLLFSSEADLIPGEESFAQQLYEYDAETGELVRVSKGELVETANGEEHFGDNGLSASSSIDATETGPTLEANFRSDANPWNIAGNGRTVVFESTGELSPRALSAEKGCSNVYEFRTEGSIAQGEIHLISDGRDVQPDKGSACGSIFTGMDGEGENILFSTADPLLSTDTNGVERDIYDARVEGGFAPIPSASETGLCAGEESCSGVQSSAPALPPASMTNIAEGNLVPTPRAPASVKSKKSTQKKHKPTASQSLAKALRACKSKRNKNVRVACEREAKRRYAPHTKGKSHGKKSGRNGR